jgi:cell division septation protein DedD/nucleoid DNA-binding protein
MAYLGTYIRQLLSNREQVILPGFGSLVVTEGRGVAGDKGRIEPPVAVVKFDPTHPKGDGKLAGAYASGEGIDPEEARQQVLELVDAIKFRLDKGEKYKLDQVGVFSRDDDNRILFSKDPDWLIDPDAFGLETLDILELESEDDGGTVLADGTDAAGRKEVPGRKEAGGVKHDGEQEQPGGEKYADGERGTGGEKQAGAERKTEDGAERQVAEGGTGKRVTASERERSGVTAGGSVKRVERKPVNKWKIIWIVVGSLIAVLVLILLIPTGNGVEFGRDGIVIRDRQEAEGAEEHAPAVEKGLKEEEGLPADEPVAEPGPVRRPAADEPGDQPKATTGHKYFIIAGSFQSLQNATELMNELKAAGFPAEMIITENRMYRVSVKSYADREQAIRELPRIKAESGMDGAWVMAR